MSGSVVWFCPARDPDALRRFYEALLSREVEEARLTSTDTGVSGAFSSSGPAAFREHL
jgi:hypothetical protein